MPGLSSGLGQPLMILGIPWIIGASHRCITPSPASTFTGHPLPVHLWTLYFLGVQSLDLGPTRNPGGCHFEILNYICKDPISKQGHMDEHTPGEKPFKAQHMGSASCLQ